MKFDAPARPGRVLLSYDGPLSLADPDWYRRALCSETATDFFFSERGEDRLYAKSVCRRCPVQTDCLVDALQHRERYGVWGGMTEMERVELLALAHPDIRELDPAPDGGDDEEAAA